jgi:hypothetical protein
MLDLKSMRSMTIRWPGPLETIGVIEGLSIAVALALQILQRLTTHATSLKVIP